MRRRATHGGVGIGEPRARGVQRLVILQCGESEEQRRGEGGVRLVIVQRRAQGGARTRGARFLERRARAFAEGFVVQQRGHRRYVKAVRHHHGQQAQALQLQVRRGLRGEQAHEVAGELELIVVAAGRGDFAAEIGQHGIRRPPHLLPGIGKELDQFRRDSDAFVREELTRLGAREFIGATEFLQQFVGAEHDLRMGRLCRQCGNQGQSETKHPGHGYAFLPHYRCHGAR
jgi:hypothetical protein